MSIALVVLLVLVRAGLRRRSFAQTCASSEARRERRERQMLAAAVIGIVVNIVIPLAVAIILTRTQSAARAPSVRVVVIMHATGTQIVCRPAGTKLREKPAPGLSPEGAPRTRILAMASPRAVVSGLTAAETK